MIKVLGLALYGPLAASTRYRLGQYVPGLATHGIDLQICHLLGDDYLRRRFNGAALPIATMLKAGFSRFSDLAKQGRYDIAMVYGELLPLMPGSAERALLRAPYVYDLDDAFYLKYRSGRLRMLQPLLGDKFESVMSGAAAVTAGNRALSEYAAKYNTQVHDLPTVVDTQRYVSAPAKIDGVFTVGWIGSPSTAPYLTELVQPLSGLGRESPVRLVVIGGKAPVIPNVTVEEVPWQEHTEVELINSFDVGVMPLPDDAWARGKCAFKLIQYMACAVPVVASRVGANVDVVAQDCGFLATSEEDWGESLRGLRDNSRRRVEMGVAGRARVEQHYSLHHNLPLLERVIRNVARRG